MGCGTVCALRCFFGISLVLQCVGFFSPRWVTISNPSECHLGLIMSNCNANEEVSKAVLGLQATSLGIISLATLFSSVHMICCGGFDDEKGEVGACGCCSGCLILLYPIAGLMILIGCIISVTEYSSSELDWGFYCCIVAGGYIIVETFCMYCLVCRAIKDADGAGGADGRVARRVNSYATMEQTEVHAIETNTGMYFIARKVTKIIHKR